MGARLSRRALLGSALGVSVAVGVGGLSGCSSGSSQPLRFAFWGPDFYQKFTQQMVDAFTSESGLQVGVERAEWSGYWDRLATEVAGSNEPDVINMDGKYLSEYAGRGVLADLGALEGLDVSGLSARALDDGRMDGKLYAISTGSIAFAVLAYPTGRLVPGFPRSADLGRLAGRSEIGRGRVSLAGGASVLHQPGRDDLDVDQPAGERSDRHRP